MSNNERKNNVPGPKNVLFSWVGFKDLNYAAKNNYYSDDDFKERLDKAKEPRPTVSKSSNYSPLVKAVKTLPKNAWSDIILFFDIEDDELGEKFRMYISNCVDTSSHTNVKLKCIKAADVHNCNSLFEPTLKAWQEETTNTQDDIIPYFNLSSGTEAMVVMLAMLGKSKYPNAKFIEVTLSAKAEMQSFNFDIKSYAMQDVNSIMNSDTFKEIKGNSPAIVNAKKLAAKAGKTDFNVLIFGESGTGKELFARAIHEASQRAKEKFMAINCASLSPNLAESQLFGSKKGAFTDAEDKDGVFKDCDKGTLFLDEIEALPPDVQAKLLRVLQPTDPQKSTKRE